MALIELDHIRKVFRTADIETVALNDVSLKIDHGEFVAVVGPSGSGKSTLLNTLGMIDQPSAGRYLFMGEDVAVYSQRRLTQIRRRRVGFIFQNFNLIEQLSVVENVELPLHYNGAPPSDRRRRALAVLERVGLAHRARHKPAQLSGGQQQRAAVARALVVEPEFILADEPTGNLDSRHSAAILSMLKDLHAQGSTLVMVTHSAQQAEEAERVIRMLDGQVVEDPGLADPASVAPAPSLAEPASPGLS